MDLVQAVNSLSRLSAAPMEGHMKAAERIFRHAAKTGAEEAINIRCMLRSLGVPVSRPTTLIGDNLGSLISTTNPGTLCKKKTSHISYHFVREANAKSIVSVRKIKTDYNLSDGFTKALNGVTFTSHMSMIFSKGP